MAKNRKCLLCGTEYSYCPTCPSDKHLPRFMTTFDSENCKDIFHTLVSNTIGDISDAEAKKILSELDLSRKESYAKETQDQIDNLLKVENKAPVSDDDKKVGSVESAKDHKRNFKTKK